MAKEDKKQSINDNYDFRIIIIDDNPEIHKDFIKTLTNINNSTELDFLTHKLFGEQQVKEDLAAGKPQTINLLLPKFKIDTAVQGQEGVELILAAIAQGNPYALAFVDIRMPPGWDGIKTIKHIWALDKDIQIVICTAYSDYSWEETVTELGQTDNLLILKKPFDHIAVRQLACALTRKWKLMQESRMYTESLESIVQERTEELQHQATHDALTDLPNRVLLEESIKKAIIKSQNEKNNFALLFFDLDRFKLINDSLSHSAGDELLRVVTNRLKENMQKDATLARIGGDEFILLVENINSPNEATEVATNLLNIISEPINIMEHRIVITSSVGICLYSKDLKLNELVRHADIAMYRAKELGGNQCQHYVSDMSDISFKNLEMETELRQAIKNEEFFLEFQPQFDIKTKTLSAVETLIRWQHPTKGILLPIDFIPLAEEAGLIVPIGEWVIREACLQHKKWLEAGMEPIRMAVNITTQQIRYYNFIKVLESILKETDVEPKYLELELTENTIINNAIVIKIIESLKQLGVHIAVDDFGTGYSSLNYLRNVSLDRLKIDRSFIQNILINHGDEVVIQAIIAMARGLNLEVLAEGVETKKQLEFLTSKDCTEIQGFYFSKPLTADGVKNLIMNNPDILSLLK